MIDRSRLPFLWLRREEIVHEETFRIRKGYSEALSESIRRWGVKTPLLCQPTPRGHRLISGWGRFLAETPKEPLPAFVLPADLEMEALWDLFLRDNDRWTAVEQARILSALQVLPEMSDDRLVTEKLPLLGLSPSLRVMRTVLRILELPEGAQLFIEEHQLGLRKTASLFRLSSFALSGLLELAKRLRLSQNQLLEAIEWLKDIGKKESRKDHEILAEVTGEEQGGGESISREEFRHRLRHRRFPELAAYQNRVAELRSHVAFTVPAQLSWDPGLEEPGLRLTVPLEDEAAIEGLEQDLAGNREALRRFFEIL